MISLTPDWGFVGSLTRDLLLHQYGFESWISSSMHAAHRNLEINIQGQVFSLRMVGHATWIDQWPETFMILINDISSPHLGKFVVTYLNEILILNRCWEERLHHVHSVLEFLRVHRFQVKGKKSIFGWTNFSPVSSIHFGQNKGAPIQEEHHHPLIFLNSLSTIQEEHHLKWETYIQKFHILIKYKKGVTNKPEDLLSRPPLQVVQML